MQRPNFKFIFLYVLCFLHFSKNEWVMLNLVFGSLTTAWWQLDDSLMTAWRQLNIFHTNFHAKSGLCSSKNEWVMLNLVFGRRRRLWPFCTFFLLFVLFVLLYFLYFVLTIHTNFHAKSGVCSSKNEWVMVNLAKWLIMNYELRRKSWKTSLIELRASRQLKRTLQEIQARPHLSLM